MNLSNSHESLVRKNVSNEFHYRKKWNESILFCTVIKSVVQSASTPDCEAVATGDILRRFG